MGRSANRQYGTRADCGAVRFNRRDVTRACVGLAAGTIGVGCSGGGAFGDEFARLECAAGGRLGVCVFDPATGAAVGHRIDERFGLCSTFKLALAGLILREIDQSRLRAGHFVSYTQADMLPYAPVTERHLADGGMTVLDLAEAAQVTSDNVAANLLLRLIDGPAGFTALLRSLGDLRTRLDRFETELNFVPPGEERDTTTPEAMARTAAALVLGDVLLPASRERLFGWMQATGTGLNRLRAGLPATWAVGDKTGTAYAEGMHNLCNDVAVATAPGSGGVVIAAYYEADGYVPMLRPTDEAILADVGRIVATAA